MACKNTLQSKTDRIGGLGDVIGHAPHGVLLRFKKVAEFIIGHAGSRKGVPHGFEDVIE